MSKNRRSRKHIKRDSNTIEKAKNPGIKTSDTAGLPNTVFRLRINRRNVLQWVAGIGLAGVGISTLHAYDKNQRTLHDLSVIGQGVPVIVQIHNPSCPTCRRLKNAVTSAIKGQVNLEFRLADITSREGKAIQDKYNVPHLTLLFFSKKGELLHTARGLLTPEQITSRINRYLPS